jgi:hypothetical protein
MDSQFSFAQRTQVIEGDKHSSQSPFILQSHLWPHLWVLALPLVARCLLDFTSAATLDAERPSKAAIAAKLMLSSSPSSIALRSSMVILLYAVMILLTFWHVKAHDTQARQDDCTPEKGTEMWAASRLNTKRRAELGSFR